MSILARSLLAASLLTLSAFPVFAETAATLPGGATAINEVHSDWTVKCGVAADATGGVSTCVVSQLQLDKTTKKRVLAIGLSAQPNGGVKGSIMMPFGLSLDSGVTLQIDDGPLTAPVHFRTCLPGGCVIPLEWPAATVTALRTAQKLKVVAQGDNGKPIPFSISMAGFASALDRAMALVPSK
jgi:invasion protein IalB